MIVVTDKKEREDDVKVADGYISLSDFNKMKKSQRSRFNASIRRTKIVKMFK
jgi:hypothetical protein